VPSRPTAADAVRVVQEAIARAAAPRWPLYVRQIRQLVRAVEPQFDERRYGFATFVDALKHSQREGVLRLERDRQGIVRVWPANQVPRTGASHAADGIMETELPVVDPAGGVHDAPPGAVPQADGDDTALPERSPSTSLPAVAAEAGDAEGVVIEGEFSEAPREAGDRAAEFMLEQPAGGGRRRRRSATATPAAPRARKTAGAARRATTGTRAPRRRKKPQEES
jgi:hypothetical protein